ncbi:MAG: terminase small subunit [Oscillospiraceae bacterium]|nr:terminase small subunit [Oscillospiraceae bacterium]
MTDTKELVKKGLIRLAQGKINDVVKLAFCDDLPPLDELKKMDLYNVSEIKKVKNGGVEIKLFDRQKALEKLYEIYNTESAENVAGGLLKALTEGDDE